MACSKDSRNTWSSNVSLSLPKFQGDQCCGKTVGCHTFWTASPHHFEFKKSKLATFGNLSPLAARILMFGWSGCVCDGTIKKWNGSSFMAHPENISKHCFIQDHLLLHGIPKIAVWCSCVTLIATDVPNRKTSKNVISANAIDAAEDRSRNPTNSDRCRC